MTDFINITSWTDVSPLANRSHPRGKTYGSDIERGAVHSYGEGSGGK